jgi:hypothetical protein
MSRRNRTRPPGIRPVSSEEDAQRAREHGRDVRARQAYSLGRAVPIPRDPNYFETAITPALVKEAADIIDRDPELIEWLAARRADHQGGPGRPSAVSLRTALICFWLMSVSQRNFHLINLAALVDALPWRIRRDLGIDYRDSRGQAKQISYNQLLRVFHNMADAFDPYAEGIGDKDEDQNDNETEDDSTGNGNESEKDEENKKAKAAYRRAADLQELCNRLLRASTAKISHNGGYAVDATLKWAWERPRKGIALNSKIERRGKDGEAGRPLTLSDVIDLDDATDLEEAGLLRDPLVSEQRKSRYEQKTWSGGADWVGRKNIKKAVFDYALHTAVVTDPDVPNVVEAMAVTTAKALPAPAIMPVLRELFDVRTAVLAATDGSSNEGARPLATVVADPAYSANVEDWQLPLRAMGANPIFRLHRTNQGGMWEERGTLFIDGYPCCPCAAHALVHEDFPTFPYTRAQLAQHHKWTKDRARFAMLPNGNWLPDGGRQFKYPHFVRKLPAGTAAGGCPHCVDAFGNPVIDPTTNRPRPRCCTSFSKKFDAHELGLYQVPSHGTEDWMDEWNPRSRVEGGYGVLKNLALVNWGRDYHHFVGLAREALVATFALMAYNFHTQRTFEARRQLMADKAADGVHEKSRRPKRKRLALPSAQPTLSTPQGTAPAGPTDPFGPKEGPAGLEFISTPRGP